MPSPQETGIYKYAADKHRSMESDEELIRKRTSLSKEAQQMNRAIAMGLSPGATIEEINAESLRLEDEMKKRERRYR